jgi:hypothetical protein
MGAKSRVNAGDCMDQIDKARLCERERARRRVLWSLERLLPGQSGATTLIDALDRIELDDQENPIGDSCAVSPSELASLVPIIKKSGRIDYVSDDAIPEPWRERFAQASLGSTRPLDGWFACDWLKFLSLWQLEMEHLAKHRKARVLV